MNLTFYSSEIVVYIDLKTIPQDEYIVITCVSVLTIPSQICEIHIHNDSNISHFKRSYNTHTDRINRELFQICPRCFVLIWKCFYIKLKTCSYTQNIGLMSNYKMTGMPYHKPNRLDRYVQWIFYIHVDSVSVK